MRIVWTFLRSELKVELDIGRNDIHDRSKQKRNVMKRMSNPKGFFLEEVY